MQIINCEQNSQEWLNCRLGKLTASEAQAIAANGKGLETLVYKLVAERLIGKLDDGFRGNSDTERGHELEVDARNFYELQTKNIVDEVGFCQVDDYVGCSPDGLVGEDGLTEFKCFKNVNFVEYLVTKKIDTGYEWQMQFQMFVTGRQWCDYVVYNPNFKNLLIIQRVNRDDRAIEKIKAGIETGKAMIKSMMEKLQ